MEIITINGENEPKILYKPYVYATVIDCSIFYAIWRNREMKIYKKKDKSGGKYEC